MHHPRLLLLPVPVPPLLLLLLLPLLHEVQACRHKQVHLQSCHCAPAWR